MEQMLVGAVVAQLTLSNSWEPCVTHIKGSGRLRVPAKQWHKIEVVPVLHI